VLYVRVMYPRHTHHQSAKCAHWQLTRDLFWLVAAVELSCFQAALLEVTSGHLGITHGITLRALVGTSPSAEGVHGALGCGLVAAVGVSVDSGYHPQGKQHRAGLCQAVRGEVAPKSDLGSPISQLRTIKAA
jgi:hypothetical protein